MKGSKSKRENKSKKSSEDSNFFKCPECEEMSLSLTHNCAVPLINTKKGRPLLSGDQEEYAIYDKGISGVCLHCGAESEWDGGESEEIGDFLRSSKFSSYKIRNLEE